MSGNRQKNKVIGKDYLFRQFQAYNNIRNEYYRILERKIARLYLKIDLMQSVLNQKNIVISFAEIDELTDAEIDEMFAPQPEEPDSGGETQPIEDSGDEDE